MSTEKTVAKPETPKASMLCTTTIYFNGEFTQEQIDAAQLIAIEFGTEVAQIRTEGVTDGTGIVVQEMSVEECNALVSKLAEHDIEFTSVMDVMAPAPEKPYLVIHYGNASKRVLRRINSLIRWIDENEPTAVIGSITELPNSRPEDGIQIDFLEGEER